MNVGIDIKLKSRDAARVARVDRQRLNEAVAAGFYTEAPVVKKGAARLFGMIDLIGLVVFREWQEFGSKPRRAGAVASDCIRYLRDNPSAPEFKYEIGRSGGIFVRFNLDGIRQDILSEMRRCRLTADLARPS